MTRVFAVLLAVCSLMLIGAGGFGIYKTQDRKQKQDAELRTIENKAEEYQELNLALAGKSDYKADKKELEELSAQYEQDNSDHRRELTEYTVKKGGLKLGTDALDQADAAFYKGKAEYEAGLKAFEEKEAEFNAGYEQFMDGKQALAKAREVYNLTLGGVSAAKQALDSMQNLEGLLESDDPDARFELSLQACDGALAAMDNASAAMEGLRAQGIISDEQAQKIEAGIADATGMSSAELRALLQTERDAVASGNPDAGMTEEEFQAFKQQYEANKELIHNYADAAMEGIALTEQELQKKGAELTAAEEEIAKMEPVMEEGRKGIEQGREMLQKAGAAIADAENQLYSSRTMIWYELGQLEEKFLELQMEKAELEGDSEKLVQLREEMEQRKKLEDRRTSLSLYLRDIPEISRMYEAGTELYDAAKIHAENFRADIKHQLRLEAAAEGLMILAGVLGFLPLVSSFGKPRDRKQRLIMELPVLLLTGICLIFGFAAGFGLFKASLVVFAAALAVLLSSIPDKKPQKLII